MTPRRGPLTWLPPRVWLGALVAVLTGGVAALLVATSVAVPTDPPPPVPTAAVWPYAPPGALNPQVTQETIRTTICVSGWTATVRPPTAYTNALKRAQLARPGYTDRDPTHYEEDHQVPLALGGAPRDVDNLWPEPWPEARRKDVVESRLHRAVCTGTLTLDQARTEMLRWTP